MLHMYVRRLDRPSRNLSSNLPSLDSCCCCCYHNGNGPKRCPGGPYVASCQSSFMTPWHGRFVNVVVFLHHDFHGSLPFPELVSFQAPTVRVHPSAGFAYRIVPHFHTVCAGSLTRVPTTDSSVFAVFCAQYRCRVKYLRVL